MTNLSGTRVFESTHRLYDLLHSLIITLDAIAIAEKAVEGLGKATPIPMFKGETLTIVSRQFSVQIEFPIFGPFITAITYIRMSSVPIDFRPQTSENPNPNEPGGFNKVVLDFVSILFINMFESHRSWIQDQYGQHPRDWPEFFRFAYVIRNAIGHGGTIGIGDPNFRPVSWHHLTYDLQSKDTKVIGEVLGIADVIVLMVEVSDELDLLGCPVP